MKKIIKKRKKMIAVFTVIIGLVSGGVLMAEWSTDTTVGDIDDTYTLGNASIGTAAQNERLTIYDLNVNGEDVRIDMRANDEAGIIRQGQIFFDPDANTIGFRNGQANILHVKDTGKVGIGITDPISELDVNGVLHLKGSQNPTVTAQGTYLGWNALVKGETDLINNQGSGTGGFAFFNTSDGTLSDPLLKIEGNGNVSIGAENSIAKLTIRYDSQTQSGVHIYNTSLSGHGDHATFCVNQSSNLASDRILTLRSGAQDRLIVSGDGKVGIGTTPDYRLSVAGTTSSVNYHCSSDIRWKKNITPIESALKKVLGLQGVNYLWKTEQYKEKNFSKTKQLGFIAQEVEKVIPELVHTNTKGYKTMNYSKLTAVLVEAIKELKNTSDYKIAALEKKSRSLEEENKSLKKRLVSLEKLESRMATLEQALDIKDIVLGMK